MKPMLARTLGPKFSQYPCYVQPKLNGVRALYQSGTFQSRDEKVWSPQVLGHLIAELMALPTSLHGLILDGELYVHGWRLQRINGAVAVNRSQPREDTKDVEFHVFDVVNPDKRFSERWFYAMLELRHANLPHIKAVMTGDAHNAEIMQQCFHFYTHEGYEGIMLRPDGKYEFGEHMGRNDTMTQYRSRTLWKHKQWEDDEFTCIGVTEGEGKAEIGIGALKLIHPDRYAKEYQPNEPWFKVGTGLTDADRIEFAQNPPIGRLVRVRYLCLTEDGIPFNPSFIAVL